MHNHDSNELNRSMERDEMNNEMVELKEVPLNCPECKGIFKLEIIKKGEVNKMFCPLCGFNAKTIFSINYGENI